MSRFNRVELSWVRRILLSWHAVPAAYQRLFLFVAVAGLGPWLTVTSFDVQGYVVGAEQVLSGQSVYGPRVESVYTGRVVPRYPYLPSFAMLVGVGIAPAFALREAGVLPPVIYEGLARQIANAPGYVALVGLPIVTYLVCTARLEEASPNVSSDWAFWGVLLVSLTPPLWFQVLESGSDTFVAILAVLGVLAVTRGRWIAAGLLVGAATFKFTGLPIAAVLTVYALKHGHKQFMAVVLGGLTSQLPNVLYFGFFFEDLLFVLEERGTMSIISGETRAIATAPIRAAGLEQWYVETGFVFFLGTLILLGATVAVYRENLVLGFAVAYLSASYFAPVGEVNSSVLVVLLLFEAGVNFRRRPVRYLAAALLAVQFYSFVIPLRLVGHISVPFPWFVTVVRGIEFLTVLVAIVGLTYYSDHGSLSAPTGSLPGSGELQRTQ